MVEIEIVKHRFSKTELKILLPNKELTNFFNQPLASAQRETNVFGAFLERKLIHTKKSLHIHMSVQFYTYAEQMIVYSLGANSLSFIIKQINHNQSFIIIYNQ